VVKARGPVSASDRRRTRPTTFVAVGAALALAGGLIAWALTERSSATKSRSDSRSAELRASELSHQLRATTGHLRDSQATVGNLNHRMAALAAETARIANERQHLRQIVADAAKRRSTDAAPRGQLVSVGGCLDSSADFADARVVGAPDARDNVDFYVGIDGTCARGVQRGGYATMVIAGAEADAVRICNGLGATRNHARFASFGYRVPGSWWLCK